MRGFFQPHQLAGGGLPLCHKCRLHQHCNSPKMEPVGSSSSGILFVGEFPGEEADDRGSPLSPRKESWLGKVLEGLRLDLDSCLYTNALICRPGKNISPNAVNYCRPNLQKTIAVHKPRVIIPLGIMALQSVMPYEVKVYTAKYAKWVGWTIPRPKLGAWVCPLENPSDFLGNKKAVVNPVIFKAGLKKAIAKLKEPFPGDYSEATLRKKVEIVLSQDEARSRLERLAKQEGRLAFDYEASGLKPEMAGHHIHACSFCFEGDGTWACLVTPDLYSALSVVLQSKRLKKIASNLKYEERWTRRILGHPVRSWYWDTMLAAHALDNRGDISSVKFQALVRLGAEPWGNEWTAGVETYLQAEYPNDINGVARAPVRELLTYCGIDSYLEFHVMQHQQKEMGLCGG